MEKDFSANEILKAIIEQRGYNKTAIARMSNIKNPIFFNILNCKRQIYFDELPRICRAIGIQPTELLSDNAQYKKG